MLPTIPLIEIGLGGGVALAQAEPARLAALHAIALRHYGRTALRVGDDLTRRWLERRQAPYLAEIAATAELLDGPGGWLLNTSYEWACTAAACADGKGNRLIRMLDWKLDGLGRNLVVAQQNGPAGDFYNIGWPGGSGVFTAMARGRFSAAINQPPAPWSGFGKVGDWLLNRAMTVRAEGWLPAHLLRHAFETCATYAEARALLTDTALCIPAFFTVSGLEPGEGCVIERSRDRSFVRNNAVVANHWIGLAIQGRPRGAQSEERQAAMTAAVAAGERDFTWVRPPIQNIDSRVAVEANARTGELQVQGYERIGKATERFTLAD